MSRHHRTEHHRHIHHHGRRKNGFVVFLLDMAGLLFKAWFILFIVLPLLMSMLQRYGERTIESMTEGTQTNVEAPVGEPAPSPEIPAPPVPGTP